MLKVSIILPVYNGSAYLKQAINSVLGQTFNDWELLIIDDGSVDGSADIIDWYERQDSRIRRIAHEQNLGLVAALNEGVALAMGEYLARIDSDDYWSEPKKLSKQVEFLDRNPHCGLLGSWARIIDAGGRQLSLFEPPASDVNIRKQMLWHNCFVHSSILVRKKDLLNAGAYRAGDLHVEDYALWLRIGMVAGLANLPEILVTYRDNPDGVTGTKYREQLSRIVNLIEEHKAHYPGYWKGWLKWRLQKLLS